MTNHWLKVIFFDKSQANFFPIRLDLIHNLL
jgi:hypothetical protein